MIIFAIVIFLITAASFVSGLWVGSMIPSETVAKVQEKVRERVKKKGETGVVKAPTPKEAKAIQDREFRQNFPQVG